MMGFLLQLKRVAADLVMMAAVLLLYSTGIYELLPPPLQLVALKALLVSSGLLSGHVAGKLLFPRVNWGGELTPTHCARIALYVVCVYAYSLGG